MKKGIFCTSFDIDFLWGRHDLNFSPFIIPLQQARKVFKTVLNKFEENNISATWAIEGHLLLKKCSPKNGIKHPEIIRPHYPWVTKDWFYHDPCTNASKDPLWYAPDIVALLKTYKNQEIACHSFSHVIFNHPGCSKECANSEIKACFNLAKKEGIKFESFIFPRNKIAYLHLLKKYGYKSYRGPQINFEGYSKIVQFLRLITPTPPPVYSPRMKNGLLNIPASLYFISARGIKKYIPSNIIFNKAKLGIDKAIENGKVFHLWTHLEDFVEHYDIKMAVFNKIIDYAIEKRNSGVLEFMSMKQITKRYNS